MPFVSLLRREVWFFALQPCRRPDDGGSKLLRNVDPSRLHICRLENLKLASFCHSGTT